MQLDQAFREDAVRQSFSASLQLASLLYHIKHEYTCNDDLAFGIRHISNQQYIINQYLHLQNPFSTNLKGLLCDCKRDKRLCAAS